MDIKIWDNKLGAFLRPIRIFFNENSEIKRISACRIEDSSLVSPLSNGWYDLEGDELKYLSIVLFNKWYDLEGNDLNNENLKPKINKIPHIVVELYDPFDKLIGMVNEYEFNDFRIQIKNNYFPGYYCMFNGEKINILKEGKIDKRPKGFFDIIDDQLDKLLGL